MTEGATLFHIVIRFNDLLTLFVCQGDHIVSRQFQTLSVIVIQDRRFFDRFSHYVFLIKFNNLDSNIAIRNKYGKYHPNVQEFVRFVREKL